MIRVIDINRKPVTQTAGGQLTPILSPSEDGTRVEVAFKEIAPGHAHRLAPGERTQVAYVLEGDEGDIALKTRGGATRHIARRGAGVYLEPGEETVVAARTTALRLLLVTVPKHTARPTGVAAPTGYFFDESQLPSLVDERQLRERTFWVNKETGLSQSWDLQLGHMRYAPHGHSPRHVHHASKDSPVTPEHFYLIERGTGHVKHDGGSLPVGAHNLVWIPAGEWHQLVASETGFEYVEFEAPFDLVTTLDHDPLGKNWYIKGTDDGTGKPQLWVQS
jgi:mannose-6-phosphate isomerase-like protein (cupin superfamily)